MITKVLDNVKFEKENAIARFNRFGKIVKLWQFFEILVVFGLISWSTARFPALLTVSGGYVVDFSSYHLNHHVVFLIGNVIIVLLFMLCRQNDVVNLSGDDLYDDYVKHSEITHQRQTALPPEPESAAEGCGCDEEKQIVVVTEEMEVIPLCDDMAAAIEEATRQISKFQKTRSEKLKREIAVRPRPELHRSETENCRHIVSSIGPQEAAEIEALSNEEFQRTVDAFIDKHWSKRNTIVSY